MGLLVTDVLLRDFRSFERLELTLAPGTTVLVGPNAAGKTNTVEAVQLLTSGASFRRPTPPQLVREGTDSARIDARLEGDGRVIDHRCDVTPTGRRFSRNGKKCRAVDMALYREGYEHLRAGQAVRVRATPLGVDEYLAVQEMSLDLMDPGQTTYTLGVSYDTLTGNQSAFLRGLNGSINEAIDRVSDAEDTIDRVVNDANTDYYLSDSPDEPLGGEWGVANIGQVDNKYLWARPHNTLVDGTEVQVKGGKLICQGEPMILEC